MNILKKLWKRKLLFVGVLILYLLGSFVYERIYTEMLISNISKKGTIVSQEKLMEDLKSVGAHELKVSNFSFYRNDRKSPVPNNSYNKYGNTIKKGKYVFESTILKSIFEDRSKPYEVRQAMRTWIYIKSRTLPFEITDVTLHFDPFATSFYTTSISRPEFEALYNQVIKEQNYDDEKLIDVLSEAWLEKKKYRQQWE